MLLMTKKQAIQLFEEKKVRTVWDDISEKWYCSIVDVVAVLTESLDPGAYWRKLKERLKKESDSRRNHNANASAAEDLSGMVLSIQLFAQAVAFIFFIFALTEGGNDEAKSKKRKYIALAVSIVSAILMEVVYKLA